MEPEMHAFAEYVADLEKLVADATGVSRPVREVAIESALDGQPAAELRRLVPAKRLREAGAFFTGSATAQRAVNRLRNGKNSLPTILDPACGAGDLLVACTDSLPVKRNLDETLKLWGNSLFGRDLHDEFIRATKCRLILAALRRGVSSRAFDTASYMDSFPNIEFRCGLADVDAISSVDNIIVNPPFTMVDSPKSLKWASGTVNSAALFLDACLTHASPASRIVAILPEVLRSGARYEKWRDIICQNAIVRKIDILGQFDRWADVHVFILTLDVRKRRSRARTTNWCVDTPAHKRIGDVFNVSVGPVVDFRAPHKGNWRPFVCSRSVAPWKTIRDVAPKRRFLGRVIEPPFVVVRRTSRPENQYRAVGTIIAGKHPVAVENHLLVLQPNDGTIKACQKLLKVLRLDSTNHWLNQRIRCRHLTVSSLSELPWPDQDP